MLSFRPLPVQEASNALQIRPAVCGMRCVGFAALVLHAQEPASYPHDMSDYGCTNRDENTCDSAPAPPPDYNPLVGTWVRYSLLRNGFSVQPPDAPLYVKFMKDGYWSMMEFPANRPKVNKPLEQQTTKELFSRFDKMSGGWGNYSNSGQVNFRHHKVGLGPGGGENTQERAWRFEGNILVLEGSGPTKSPQIHARKLPNQKLGSTALVGSWERTAYTVNGAAGTTTPEHLLLGEDGWYHATTLPAGRKGVPKVPAGSMDAATVRGRVQRHVRFARHLQRAGQRRSCAATSAIPIRISKTS